MRYNKSKFHLHKTDGIVSDYLNARESHFLVLISQFKLFVVFKVIVAAGLLLLGGTLVFQERMNIGQFVAAEIIILLIINSVEKLFTTLDVVYDVLTAVEKIGYVTDLEMDNETGNAGFDTDEGLEIKAREIAFSFAEDRKNIFDNLSFEIASNEKIVLSGKTGSGKSLLLQIIAGLHQIQDGELYINNRPVVNYSKNDLYDNLGIAFPTNQIFEGTFRENILLGRDIDDKVITQVLDVLSLNDFLIHKNNGIDSLVDSGGRRLPRSIIQKILIARLIIGQPKLLLLEGSLQFIDIDEKKRIIDYIMSSDRHWTVIVVSDFSYWREKCDRVIELTND